MKRIFIASLVTFASAAAFAQAPSGAEPAPAHHHSSKHHKKHAQKHKHHQKSHQGNSVADRAVPLDSPDYKP
jgi:Spy/CpxP family protein refolding chaperone